MIFSKITENTLEIGKIKFFQELSSFKNNYSNNFFFKNNYFLQNGCPSPSDSATREDRFNIIYRIRKKIALFWNLLESTTNGL